MKDLPARESVPNRTVLFTGRFDDPHIGHIATIQRLGAMFDKVIVVVLDYPQQRHPIDHRFDVLRTVLARCMGNYEIVTNQVNFENATKDEVAKYTFNVYASGNPKCIDRMKSLGYDCLSTARSWDYAASKMP